MRVLDLFSGIGGFSLGLERAGMEIGAMCEIDEWCRGKLAKHWPHVPIFADIRELDGETIGTGFDVVCGGFPCQPWSVAGRRGGHGDDRDLWPEMRRIVGLVRPRWVVGENVPGLDDERYMALDGVLRDLEALGYEAVPFEIPACAVDAPQKRSRIWIVAHTRHQSGSAEHWQQPQGGGQHRLACHVADGDDARPQGYGQSGERAGERAAGPRGGECGAVGNAAAVQRRQVERIEPDGDLPAGGHWDGAEWLAGPDGKARRVKPGIRLLAHGVPERVARLRALGNAVVPQVVERIGRAVLLAGRASP